jgi:hypothetical protein
MILIVDGYEKTSIGKEGVAANPKLLRDQLLLTVYERHRSKGLKITPLFPLER